MEKLFAALAVTLTLMACSQSNTSIESIKDFRMAQYGFMTGSGDGSDEQIRSIESLESLVKPYVVVKRNQPATLNAGISTAQAGKAFGISAQSTAQELEQWTTWFNNRFKPVYLSHVAALYYMACSRDLEKTDLLLDTSNQLDFLKKVAPSATLPPYQVMVTPFTNPVDDGKNQLRVTASDIATMNNALIDHLENTREERDQNFKAVAVPMCD
jgi:hypothetical protein